MLPFLVLVMGVFHLLYIKNYWSQEFVYRVPFFDEVLTRNHFLHIFWMLHLETVSTTDHNLRTRTQKLSLSNTYLHCIDTILFLARLYHLTSLWLVSNEKFYSLLTTQKTNWMGNPYACSGRLCLQLCLHVHPVPWQNHYRQPRPTKLPFTSWIVLQLFYITRDMACCKWIPHYYWLIFLPALHLSLI